MADSPVKVLLEAIFRNARKPGDREWSVFSYRDTNDFDKLWRIDGPLDDVTNLKGDLVIIWDSLPEPQEKKGTEQVDKAIPGPTINIADHVTVFDWIVALCCKARMLEKDKLPDLRLFILDLAPPQHASAFGTRMFSRFLPDLPWLRVYRPVARNEDAFKFVAETCMGNAEAAKRHRPVLGPDFLGAEALLADFRLGGNGDNAYPTIEMPYISEEKRLGATVDSLRSMWVNELTKPEMRHSVSNLIAPFALAAGLCHLKWDGSAELRGELDKKNPQRFALRRLLESLGLIDAQSGKPPKGKGTPLANADEYFPAVEKDPFGRFDNVRLLLVDDQYSLGYETVLRCLLFGEQKTHPKGRVKLTVDSSPGCLVDALYATAGLRVPPEHAGDGPEIGVLRRLIHFYDSTGACAGLYGDDAALYQAIKSARRIVGTSDLGGAKLCDRCGTRHVQGSFDWQLPHVFGKSPDRAEPPAEFPDIILLDLRLFGDARQSVQEHRPDLYHHVLLPLLISHVDPSFPIILFSSTQQRVVAEALAARPNIITDFSKPLVSGYAQENAGSEAVNQLKNALYRAARLHNSRAIWKSLTELSDSVPIDCAGSLIDFEHEPCPFDKEEIKQLANEYSRLFPRRFFADALAVPGNILDRLNVRTHRAEYGADEVNNLTAYFFYRVIESFRNLRAHYVVAPGFGEEKLEQYAVLIWSWLLAGVTAFKNGRDPIEPGPDLTPQRAGGVRRDWGKNSKFDSCQSATRKLAEALRQDLVALSEQMWPLKNAVMALGT